MKLETVLELQRRLQKETNGLTQMIKQFEQEDTASTIVGLKSSLLILAKSLRRTNEVIFEMTQQEVVKPEKSDPFASFNDASGGKELFGSKQN